MTKTYDRIEAKVTMGTFSKGENKRLLESMYEDLRKACADIDNDYGGAGFVALRIAKENGKTIRKSGE